MDHARFISVVKQFPQVWDRNCATFREQSLKSEAWERIGEIMNCPASSCKDTFKSLREKYVREREKQAMYADKYMPWQHLESLSFLDPHIILRKQSLNYDSDMSKLPLDETKMNMTDEPFFVQLAENYSDFDKTLIALVRKASPIWDRKSNGYPNKQVKYQLWRGIAQAMNKDINVCMMRWKGLREKYIRQKNKYQEGEGKWEFLDDMSFLDKVIQYRRKNCEPDMSFRPQSGPAEGFPFHNDMYDDNSMNSSSNDFIPTVKSEDFGCDMQDSSYDSGTASSGRKRSASDNSESSYEKREKVEEIQKSPEAMFGELVAAMLAKKTERDKNIAMIEIMKVLTK
ncbi:hypothetical protein TcasGA2_TC009795 [Tribolium castaneum]|uniref:MADF domain-containing protein n=1 Tax=Tribolium castaneum TaxID=7070 RepID=D6WPQ1_TRICA|nr:PREDICTED: transcription factor Adf-1 [Tribolium castaneum]EFA06852.1 hypothetical protein TcasGA2_TC009795 [Tribolium castaneum]|eukprot:XP_008195592.1 PREDICTED: transcription factor Adf-1 [Tribolium castaneum]